MAVQGSRRRFVADGLLGLGAFGLVLVVLISTKSHQDVRPVVVVCAAAFFVAGFLASARQSGLNWAGGLVLALSGIAPVLALSYLRLAMTDHVFLTVYVLIALAAVSAAVVVQWLAATGRAGYAAGLAIAVVAVTAGAAFKVIPAIVEQQAFTAVNRTVRPFTIRGLDGGAITSQSWRGRVVVLSYWATWCPPCQAEMPQIAALQRKYAADPRVVILPLNAAYAGDTAEKATAFLQRKNLGGAQAVDDIRPAGAHAGEAAHSLGLKVVPTLYILDQSGRLVAVHTGYDGAEHLVDTLSARIDRLLAAGRS